MQRIVPLVLLLSACGSTGESTDTTLHVAPGLAVPSQPEPKPWTAAFNKKAVLVAEVVHIEGPDGLLEHVATRPIDGQHVQTVETTENGFLQTIVAQQPGVSLEIQAVLDNLQVVAYRQLTVLERPGGSTVSIVARGDAYYEASEEGEPKRAPVLKLVGKLPR